MVAFLLFRVVARGGLFNGENDYFFKITLFNIEKTTQSSDTVLPRFRFQKNVTIFESRKNFPFVFFIYYNTNQLTEVQ